jgi:hypothetical protein
MPIDPSFKDLNRASTERIKKLAGLRRTHDILFIGGRYETYRYIRECR